MMDEEFYFQDMIIDTPEALKRLEEVLDNPVKYVQLDIDIVFNDPEFIRRLGEKYK